MSQNIAIPYPIPSLTALVSTILIGLLIAFNAAESVPNICLAEDNIHVEISNQSAKQLSDVKLSSTLTTDVGNIPCGEMRCVSPILSNDGCFFLRYFSYLDSEDCLHTARMKPVPSFCSVDPHLFPRSTVVHITVGRADQISWFITGESRNSTIRPTIYKTTAHPIRERRLTVHAPKTLELDEPVRMVFAPQIKTIGNGLGFTDLAWRIERSKPDLIIFNADDVYNNRTNSTFPAVFNLLRKTARCTAMFDRTETADHTKNEKDENHGYSENGLVGFSNIVQLDSLGPDEVDTETIWSKGCRSYLLNAHMPISVTADSIEGCALQAIGFKLSTTHFAALKQNEVRTDIRIVDVIP